MISYHIISYYIIFTYKLYYNGMIFDPMTDPGWSYTMVYLALWKIWVRQGFSEQLNGKS